jgi:hypothetical protein
MAMTNISTRGPCCHSARVAEDHIDVQKAKIAVVARAIVKSAEDQPEKDGSCDCTIDGGEVLIEAIRDLLMQPPIEARIDPRRDGNSGDGQE